MVCTCWAKRTRNGTWQCHSRRDGIAGQALIVTSLALRHPDRDCLPREVAWAPLQEEPGAWARCRRRRKLRNGGRCFSLSSRMCDEQRDYTVAAWIDSRGKVQFDDNWAKSGKKRFHMSVFTFFDVRSGVSALYEQRGKSEWETARELLKILWNPKSSYPLVNLKTK